MCQEGLTAWATLWRACEECGCYPEQLSRLLCIGIPKAEGNGLRPTAAYPGLARVALKARRPLLQAFDQSLERRYFSAAKQVAVWGRRVEASNPGRGGSQAGWRHYAVMCWNLKSMYDLLGHRRLIARAGALGMPREVAITTLSSHRWPRLVVADTLVHPAILPNRGVMPGCPGACTRAKVALISGMDDCAQAYAGRPGVSLNAHVDDITVGCVGNTRAEVVGLVAEVMES